MAKVIAIGNHKGGVGKTTTTLNLGAALCRKEGVKGVLLVDFDPQTNLTQCLGFENPEPNIYEWLGTDSKVEPLVLTPKLHLLPAHEDLAGAELELCQEAGREYFLRDLLEPLQKEYDYILIDCPPSLGLLTLNALTAANEVLVTVQTDYLPLRGLKKLLEVVEKVKKRLNKELKVGGIVCTQYDHRRTLDQDVVEELKTNFGKTVFNTKIRVNVALAEAPTVGKDVLSYAPDSNGAQDYLALATETITRWN